MTDLKSVWKSQPEEEETMISLSDIRVRADKLQSSVRLRNAALLLYALFNIGFSFWLIATGRQRAYLYPMLAMVAAHLFVLWQVNRRVGRRRTSNGERPVIDAYRDELRRQADGLSSAWLWYIAPFMPPFLWELAILFGIIQARAAETGQAPYYSGLILCIVAGIAFWTAVWLAFSRASVRLQLQIERLNAVKAE